MKKNAFEFPIIEKLYRVTPDDFDLASKTLGDAFRDDPIWKEIMKGQEEKYSYAFGVPLKYTLKYGQIYAPTSELDALAVWLPTPYVDMTMWRIMRSGCFPIARKLGSDIAKQISKIFKQITKDRKQFMKGAYVYLSGLGVSPEKQGKGLGSFLIRTMQEHLPPNIPIYLETESERNVRFYERLGFEVLNQIQVPILDLPMWEMMYRS